MGVLCGEAEARQRPQEDGPATIEGEEGARGQAGRPRRVGQGRQQREACDVLKDTTRSAHDLWGAIIRFPP